MTATAPTSYGLEIANADAMELLSDSGYHLGDRDIDFDLGSANGDQDQQDDVLSLQDAGTDGGMQDDLMVDKEDLIEEDEIDYNDLELEDAAGNFPTDSANVLATTNESTALPETVQALAEADEPGDDLIDYSDLDYEPGEQDIVATQVPHATAHYSPEGSGLGLASEQNLAPSTWEEPLHEAGTQQTSLSDDQYSNDKPEQQPNDVPYTEWQQVEHQDGHKSDYEERKDTFADQQVVEEENHKEPDHLSNQGLPQTTNSDHEDNVALNNERKSEAGAEEKITDDPEQGQALHPVTINYDGSELWLFRPHNDEEDGDWLLSDESLATQQFPYLFHACRAQLGDDISSETELGLRFENFPGLELFEDCTACAYTTLQELLDCYLSLHAQDGNTEPEPFYISLQFRSRVLTLVNELKKAASDQIGFSAFNDRVASGKSSFTPAVSDIHTGPYSEHWDEEGQEEVEEEPLEKENIDEVPQSKEQEPQGMHVDTHSEHEQPSPVVNADHIGEQGEPTRADALSSRSRSASHEDDEDSADDIIDYSDEEDVVDDTQSGHGQTNASSSASSTVQGDEIQHAHNSVGNDTNPIEIHDDERQSNSDHAPSIQDNMQGQASLDAVDVQYEGDDADNFTYPDNQAFDEAFDQHFDPEVTVEAQDLEDFSAYDADTTKTHGQYYDDVDDVVDPQGAGFTHDADENVGSAEDGVNGVDDFFDLNGGTEDASNEDPAASLNDEDEIGYDDEEDATEPASAIPSVAAPPAVTSPTGLKSQSSPLVQKRPFDEVDYSVEGTSETTGQSHRYHWSLLHSVSSANLPFPDAKRTKL
ncbi:hypothetical protein K491DRAFT_754914 [Lophiostoma macrostomum CBS 122681]|uniref:Uncharacterized protein n=1 Tax=Lophiostoma macrostomum CBS 122681 TaxID=1314788 RepID=A0A6A6TL73_9PLEO|nr:hypothetical protein K491DRAFT_754914 [Lophiostoma macrostomum CBS 122681]